MPEIRLITDELKRLGQRMEMEVSDPLMAAQTRISTLMNRIGLDRPSSEGFSRIAGPKIMEMAGRFSPHIARQLEASEKLTLAVRYFEDVDNVSVGRQAAMREVFPEWLWNRDFALCLLMDITREELAVFFPYGNLLSGSPQSGFSLFLSTMQNEIPEIVPGSFTAKAAETILSQLDIAQIMPGTLEAELYLLSRDLAEILPGSAEENIYIQCIEDAYAIKFEGNWPKGLRLMIACGVKDVGDAFGEELNLPGPGAFREVFAANPNDHMFFIWGTTNTEGATAEGNRIYGAGNTIHAGGYTTNKHLMNFATISNLSSPGQVDGYIIPGPDDTPGTMEEKATKWREIFQRGRNTAVHELGHAFTDIWIQDGGKWPPEKPDNELKNEEPELRGDLYSDFGFYGHSANCGYISSWRQHPPSASDPAPAAGEHLADMFLGWTYDTWSSPPAKSEDVRIGAVREEYMRKNMPDWIREAVNAGGR